AGARTAGPLCRHHGQARAPWPHSHRLFPQSPRRHRGRGVLDARAPAGHRVGAARLGRAVREPEVRSLYGRQPPPPAGVPEGRSLARLLHVEAEDSCAVGWAERSEAHAVFGAPPFAWASRAISKKVDRTERALSPPYGAAVRTTASASASP